MSKHSARFTGQSFTSWLKKPLPFPPVVFFVHQMVAGAEGHQVGVVGWRRDGDWAGTAHVGVAQLVGEQLELVSGKTIVVPQYMVVGGPTGALREGNQMTHLSY